MVGRWLVVFERHSFDDDGSFLPRFVCTFLSIFDLARTRADFRLIYRCLALLMALTSTQCVCRCLREYIGYNLWLSSTQTNRKLRPKLEPNILCCAKRDRLRRTMKLLHELLLCRSNELDTWTLTRMFPHRKFDSYWMREENVYIYIYMYTARYARVHRTKKPTI